jgi:hypothetical protein
MHIYEPSTEQKAEWAEWLSTRPEQIKKLAERFNPWTLYRMKSTGHRVTLESFDEEHNGTVSMTVAVTGQFNQVAFDRCVFGVKVEDLEECDLPTGPVGTALTQEQVDENLDVLRVLARPDLWALDPAGKAKWIGPERVM